MIQQDDTKKTLTTHPERQQISGRNGNKIQGT